MHGISGKAVNRDKLFVELLINLVFGEREDTVNRGKR